VVVTVAVSIVAEVAQAVVTEAEAVGLVIKPVERRLAA